MADTEEHGGCHLIEYSPGADLRLARFWMLFGLGCCLSLALFKTRGEAQPNSFTEAVKGVCSRGRHRAHGPLQQCVIEMKGLVVIDRTPIRSTSRYG